MSNDVTPVNDLIDQAIDLMGLVDHLSEEGEETLEAVGRYTIDMGYAQMRAIQSVVVLILADKIKGSE